MESNENYKLLREVMSALIGKLEMLEESWVDCCNITLVQAQTLVEIGRVGSISLGDLSGLLNLDNSTMSRTVNNLVVKRYCAREADKQDRRYVAIRLTEAGQSLYERIEQGMDGYYETIFKALPEEKQQQVLESCQLLLASIAKSGCC
jgi:DNA-binding MarR family transcriptional regulator